ncbi:glycosyltransferase family 4 protein [Phytohabitans flavus]|uniref:Glycosyl transferase n=2 Tax=Phytohabitans flavus TaxID=1076124 RepID=A0A6F8XQR9_9ACTN|nr:glycosyl transferase [Phytohabitans flavus]
MTASEQVAANLQQLGRETAHSIPRQRTAPDTDWRPLSIAMIGQKGMPATYGGVERHVEELGSRLVSYGHTVTVFCRDSYGDLTTETHRGVRLRRVRTVASKHLDAIVHSAASTMVAMREKPDVVHYHGLGPGLVAPLPRYLSGAKVVLTVHGLDHTRAKWGRAARTVLNTAYWFSGHVPDARIAVSRGLAAHYDAEFGRLTRYQPNGVNPANKVPPDQITARFRLTPGRYVLLVGRLVPEKRADLLIRAFRRLPLEANGQGPDDVKLAVVGGSSYTDDFVAHLKATAEGDPRVVFTGFAYGDLLAELYSHAAVFVQPSHVEGLPLTLLEAASYGLPVVASDISPHVEVLEREGPGHRLFRDGDEDDLVRALQAALANPRAERAGALGLHGRVMAHYSWDAAARQLERLYLDLATKR